MRHACLPQACGIAFDRSLLPQSIDDLTGLDRPHARKSMHELSLSVAFHAAQTDDFAGMQVEAAAIDGHSAVVATDYEFSHGNQWRAARTATHFRRRKLFADDETDKWSTIIRPQVGRADHAPRPHDNCPIATIVKIIKLVADQDSRHAALLKGANKAQQPFAL